MIIISKKGLGFFGVLAAGLILVSCGTRPTPSQVSSSYSVTLDLNFNDVLRDVYEHMNINLGSKAAVDVISAYGLKSNGELTDDAVILIKGLKVYKLQRNKWSVQEFTYTYRAKTNKITLNILPEMISPTGDWISAPTLDDFQMNIQSVTDLLGNEEEVIFDYVHINAVDSGFGDGEKYELYYQTEGFIPNWSTYHRALVQTSTKVAHDAKISKRQYEAAVGGVRPLK